MCELVLNSMQLTHTSLHTRSGVGRMTRTHQERGGPGGGALGRVPWAACGPALGGVVSRKTYRFVRDTRSCGICRRGVPSTSHETMKALRIVSIELAIAHRTTSAPRELRFHRRRFVVSSERLRQVQKSGRPLAILRATASRRGCVGVAAAFWSTT